MTVRKIFKRFFKWFRIKFHKCKTYPEDILYGGDGSGTIVYQTGSREYVSRSMAIDAGDESLEGSMYSDDRFEFEQCQWCYERNIAINKEVNK